MPLARGFTLLEVLTVVAILALVGAAGLAAGFESYGGTLFRDDTDTLRTALLHARAEALHSVCEGAACTGGAAHGVAIVENRYVVFEGAAYALRTVSEDEVFDGNAQVTRAGLSEVVFGPGNADVALPGDFVITGTDGRVSTTSVNSEGAVTWER